MTEDGPTEDAARRARGADDVHASCDAAGAQKFSRRAPPRTISEKRRNFDYLRTPGKGSRAFGVASAAQSWGSPGPGVMPQQPYAQQPPVKLQFWVFVTHAPELHTGYVHSLPIGGAAWVVAPS